MNIVEYYHGYGYQLATAYQRDLRPFLDAFLPIPLTLPIATDWIGISTSGALVLAKGYAWDGPSGPTFDTPDFLQGSLVHDALYQLMRLNLLDPAIYRETADKILRAICIEDGMPHFRAEYVYQGVRLFAAKAASLGHDKELLVAPRPVTQTVIIAIEQPAGG